MIKYLSSEIFPGISVNKASNFMIRLVSATLSVISDSPDKLLALGFSADQINVLHQGVASRNVRHQLAKHFPMLKPKMIEELSLTYGKDALARVRQTSGIAYECGFCFISELMHDVLFCCY